MFFVSWVSAGLHRSSMEIKTQIALLDPKRLYTVPSRVSDHLGGASPKKL